MPGLAPRPWLPSLVYFRPSSPVFTRYTPVPRFHLLRPGSCSLALVRSLAPLLKRRTRGLALLLRQARDAERHEHQYRLRSAPRSVPSDNYRALRALLPNTKTNNHLTRTLTPLRMTNLRAARLLCSPAKASSTRHALQRPASRRGSRTLYARSS